MDDKAVIRYEVDVVGDVCGPRFEMAAHPSGDWVRYEDYAAQATDLAEVRTAYENRTRDYYAAGDAVDYWKARAEAAESRLSQAEAERDGVRALLPGVYYMDPPDGGSVTVLEQLQRMAKDAARYRWLRDEAAESPAGNPCAYRFERGRELPSIVDGESLDAAIDAARAAGGREGVA